MVYFRNLIILSLAFLGSSEFASQGKDALLMDTFVRVEIRDPMGRDAKSRIIDRVITRMKILEKKFNYFSEGSELAVINRLRAGEKILLSDEMFTVLKRAKEINFKTKGLFDVTLGEGGFRLNAKRKTLYFEKDGVKIDLGGIAKGFIVDEGAAVLKKLGVRNAIINAGGDIYCLGEGSSDGWKVGIRNPRNPREVVEILKLRDKGVATSGGYERFIEINGEKLSHIINPRTKERVKEIFKSVTVVADDCMTADGLATALYIMGPEEALFSVKKFGGAYCVIVDENGRIYMSSSAPE